MKNPISKRRYLQLHYYIRDNLSHAPYPANYSILKDKPLKLYTMTYSIEELIHDEQSRSDIHILSISKNYNNIHTEIIPVYQRQQLSKYRKIFDVKKRLLARSYLFEYVENTLGIKNFQLDYNQYGKPFLINQPNFHFSISYSGDLAVIAMSSLADIGIDIEWIDPQLEYKKIMSEIFCLSEYTNIESCNENSPQRARSTFFDIFTAKESIVKATGTGLHIDLKLLDTNREVFHYEKNMFKQKHHYLMPEYSLSIAYKV